MTQLVLLLLVVLVVCYAIGKGKRSSKNSGLGASSTIKSFQSEKASLLAVFEKVPAANEKGKSTLLVKLFAWAVRSMVDQLPLKLSCFKQRRLTEEEQQCLALESAVYLYFYSDVLSFSMGMTDDARLSYEKMVWQNILNSFVSDEDDIPAIIQDRLDTYTRSYQSKSAQHNPAGYLLDHLKVLADTGKLNQSMAIPLYGMFERMIDWQIVQQMNCYYLFLDCLKAVFTAKTDFQDLGAAEMKDLMISAARTAKQVDLSPKKRELASV